MHDSDSGITLLLARIGIEVKSENFSWNWNWNQKFKKCLHYWTRPLGRAPGQPSPKPRALIHKLVTPYQ